MTDASDINSVCGVLKLYLRNRTVKPWHVTFGNGYNILYKVVLNLFAQGSQKPHKGARKVYRGPEFESHTGVYTYILCISIIPPPPPPPPALSYPP